jgi:hypothetical protein
LNRHANTTPPIWVTVTNYDSRNGVCTLLARSETFPMCGMKIRKTSNDELGGTRLRVSFLYYEECPSHDLALERLRKVMAEEGTPGEMEVIKVESEEQAHELHFVGFLTHPGRWARYRSTERCSLRSNLPRLPPRRRPYLPPAYQGYDPACFQVPGEGPTRLAARRIERW